MRKKHLDSAHAHYKALASQSDQCKSELNQLFGKLFNKS